MNHAILRPITPRQREIWKLLASGVASKDVAEQIGVCTDTIVRHRADLMRNLRDHGFEVRNTSDLTRAAVANRIIEVPVLPTGKTI